MKILAAVSGGVDSIVMLHLLRQDHDIGVVHFDHQLRRESANEALYVEELAKSFSMPFWLCRKDIRQLSGGKSIEEFARNERRIFFEEIRQQHGYDYIALAHHADDQAETVLNNFIRGSSVHGLGGMLEMDKDTKIIRPLFKYTKDEIYKIAREKNLSWFEDASNHETDYDRCWLRNEIIPSLETRRPVRKILADRSVHFQQISDFLHQEAMKWFGDEWNNAFHINAYLDLHTVMRGEILGIIWKDVHGTKNGFSQTVINEVNRWLEGKPEGGSRIKFGSFQMTIRKNIVRITQTL